MQCLPVCYASWKIQNFLIIPSIAGQKDFTNGIGQLRNIVQENTWFCPQWIFSKILPKYKGDLFTKINCLFFNGLMCLWKI